jgi:hypothetical protein
MKETKEKAEPASPARSTSPLPLRKDLLLMSIADNDHRRTRRLEGKEALPTLREAFSQRPEWRRFSPHQLSVLMFLYGYSSEPLADFDVEAALPFALEDWEGAA